MRRKDNSLKYFPWHKFNSQILKHFFKKYQMFGRGFVLTLLEQIAYSSNGFWISWTKSDQQDFCDDFNIRTDKFNDMFNMLLDLNFFDKSMYEKYQILTNEQIQEAFIEIKAKKQIDQVEYIEYILPCFAHKIYELTLKTENTSGNVDNTTENNDLSTQTKQNSNFVDKSVKKNLINIYNNATAEIKNADCGLSSPPVYSLTDINFLISNLNESDKSRFDLLIKKFDDKETFSFDFVQGDFKISAYKVIFSFIDLLNSKNDRFTIKIGDKPQSINKQLLIQIIYELTIPEFAYIVNNITVRKDIRNLPYYILGMIVRLDNKKQQEKMQEEQRKLHEQLLG